VVAHGACRYLRGSSQSRGQDRCAAATGGRQRAWQLQPYRAAMARSL
jgi:hypothetical protein